MKTNMEFNDVMICLFAIGIAVFTVFDRVKTRKEDREQAELTKTILEIQSDVSKTQGQMDSTLKNVSNVQAELVSLQRKMDEVIHDNAKIEKNYKTDRRKEAKALFISSSDAILQQLDRLSVHGYYRLQEYRFMAREHFNRAHDETIKLKSNIYVTENKGLHDLVNELESMFNLYGPHINTYENEDNGLGGLGDQVGPIRNKFRKVLMEVRGNDDL